MAHPRDWFRRRRRESLAVPSEVSDPLSSGPVLNLGRGGTMLLDAPEPRLTALAMAPAESGGRAGGSVPPPPARERPARAVHVLDRDAFDIRPEIHKAIEAPAARPAAKTDDTTESPGRAAVFTVKKAVPLARRMASTGAAPSAAPASAQGATIHALASPPAPAAAPQHAAEQRSTAQGASTASATVHPLPPARPQPPAPPRPQPVASPLLKPISPDSGEDGEEGDDRELPGFSLAAPGVSWVRSATTLKDVGAMNAVLREAFTPTRPKQGGKLFSGRARQMQRIIAAIEEERAHIVLYGERGSGKTSLANIIMAKAEEAGYFLLRSACSSELSFDEIFRGFLKRIPSTFLADGMGATRAAGLEHFEQLVPPGELHVGDLIQTLSRIHDRHVILVIDEYDRITSETTKNKLAEFIKNMSDASAPVTVLLIGVAENVDELLGKHPSLQRTLVTIPLPLMSSKEIAGIIVAGEQKSGLRFEDDVRRAIVDFSQGLPYHAQLLCLFAARSAVRRHSMIVGREDLRYALHRAVEEAEGRVKEAYTVAVSGQGGAAFKDAMFAAARCPCDEFGTFTLDAVVEAAGKDGESAAALQYPLKKLTEPERGGVLRKIATADGLRYQFFNQMMRHHVLVRGSLERGLV